MCGIVGYIGSRDVSATLIEGLRLLEYRGYDSAGIAVAARSGVPRNARSASSIASHRVSRGERFHRSHRRHTTQSRPFAASYANRRPTGKCSITSFDARLA